MGCASSKDRTGPERIRRGMTSSDPVVKRLAELQQTDLRLKEIVKRVDAMQDVVSNFVKNGDALRENWSDVQTDTVGRMDDTMAALCEQLQRGQSDVVASSLGTIDSFRKEVHDFITSEGKFYEREKKDVSVAERHLRRNEGNEAKRLEAEERLADTRSLLDNRRNLILARLDEFERNTPGMYDKAFLIACAATSSFYTAMSANVDTFDAIAAANPEVMQLTSLEQLGIAPVKLGGDGSAQQAAAAAAAATTTMSTGSQPSMGGIMGMYPTENTSSTSMVRPQSASGQSVPHYAAAPQGVGASGAPPPAYNVQHPQVPLSAGGNEQYEQPPMETHPQPPPPLFGMPQYVQQQYSPQHLPPTTGPRGPVQGIYPGEMHPPPMFSEGGQASQQHEQANGGPNRGSFSMAQPISANYPSANTLMGQTSGPTSSYSTGPPHVQYREEGPGTRGAEYGMGGPPPPPPALPADVSPQDMGEMSHSYGDQPAAAQVTRTSVVPGSSADVEIISGDAGHAAATVVTTSL